MIGRRAGFARLARELAHTLDVGQQILAVLLDEHAAERVADQAHVAPQGRVAAGRGTLRGRRRGSRASRKPKSSPRPARLLAFPRISSRTARRLRRVGVTHVLIHRDRHEELRMHGNDPRARAGLVGRRPV